MSLLPRDERTRRSPSPYKSGAPHRVRADKTKIQTLQLKPVLPDVPFCKDASNTGSLEGWKAEGEGLGGLAIGSWMVLGG